jgi:hypothetical protein
MTPTSTAQLDSLLKDLQKTKAAWLNVGLAERIKLLQQCKETTLAAAEDFARDACAAKGIPFESSVSAEEWMAGPVCIMRNLRLLIETLESLQKNNNTGITAKQLHTRADGQVVAHVLPNDLKEKLLYGGFNAEVWQEPGQTIGDVLQTTGWIYRGDKPKPKVALVLGAGNVSSIGPLDVLYKLFAEDQVCLLKMNPVNEYTGPHVVNCLRPLFDAGFVKIAYGGAEVGAYLVAHAAIDEIHITGSDAVHDMIVWGVGDEQKTNKAKNTPKIKKRITSELGCITPVIIVPGEWSAKELDFQAQNVATMVANNGSFNCNAAKVLLTSAAWKQRDLFLEKVETILAKIPQRQTYYPGSDKKYAAFVQAHPEAKTLGPKPTAGKLAWTTIFHVDPKAKDDIVFNREAWCGVVAETGLPESDPADFLKTAVKFCNNRLWGTLSCSVIVDPRTAKNKLGEVLETAIADLRYGSVAINHWAGMSYAFGQTVWGAFPGHTLQDIGSGIGFVHNTYLFKNPQKSVIRGPFIMSPLPPWFTTHRNGDNVARKVLAYEYAPSLCKIPGIALAALKG